VAAFVLAAALDPASLWMFSIEVSAVCVLLCAPCQMVHVRRNLDRCFTEISMTTFDAQECSLFSSPLGVVAAAMQVGRRSACHKLEPNHDGTDTASYPAW
jgi:hypothetical protein